MASSSRRKESQRCCWLEWLPDLDQGSPDLLRVAHTNRKIVAPRAPLAGPTIEPSRTDALHNVLCLLQIVVKACGIPRRDVPLDPGLSPLHEYAERELLGFGYGELVGAQLV